MRRIRASSFSRYDRRPCSSISATDLPRVGDHCAESLGEQLAAKQIDPPKVALEVTEHGLTEDEELLAAALPRCARGCDIAIDDSAPDLPA